MQSSTITIGTQINELVDGLKGTVTQEQLQSLLDKELANMIMDLQNKVPVSDLSPEDAYKRGVLVGRASVYMELTTGREIKQ